MTTDNDDAQGSVTRWIGEAKVGDQDAARQLWTRYFERLVRLCRKKMPYQSLRVEDEEDVVVSALGSFYDALQEGHFSQLSDRDDLWRLLVVMTNRKAVDHLRHHRRQKRGADQVVGESVLDNDASNCRGLEQIVTDEPTPEFAALMAEECERRLADLDNELLQLIALKRLEGHSNLDIARELNCSVRTVERKLSIIRGIWLSGEREDDSIFRHQHCVGGAVTEMLAYLMPSVFR